MIPWWVALVTPWLPAMLTYWAARSSGRKTDQDFYRQKIADLETEVGHLKEQMTAIIADNERKTTALLEATQLQLEHAWRQAREEKERADRYESTAERERSKFQQLAIETAGGKATT